MVEHPDPEERRVEIRPYSQEDAGLDLSGLYERSWRYAYRGILPDSYFRKIPSGQWAKGLEQPGRSALLLLEDGRLIGASSYGKARLGEMRGYGEVVSLYLLPEKIGMGYGKRLLRAAVEALERQGFHRVYLWVVEENRRARDFYERFGFRQSGRVDTARYDGKECAEVMYTYRVPQNLFETRV